ncbi:MAG: hypothetical protein HGA36_00610 [Candidatus Moranbacteria bacterium]|nr:hypothetical protein [Candidatus Moranbacteria bacterium]
MEKTEEKEIVENETDVIEEKTEKAKSSAMIAVGKALECVKGKVKCLKDGTCKCDNKKWIILVVAILVIAISASYGYKVYRQKVDVGSEAVKAKVEKFLSENVPPTAKTEIKDITEDGSLYKLTVVVDKQEIPVFVTRDGKKLMQAQTVMELDKAPADPAQQAQAPEEQKEIPKTDKPTVDLYVMSFCPYGNKAEDTLKPVYDLLKNKVNFNFHYIVSTSGSDIKSLHGPKEVTENEKEACVLKTYGKDKWMAIVTYVNTNCGSDGACFEVGAKTLAIDPVKVNNCVTAQGLTLMQQNEKDSNAANATGSPTMTINGVSSNAVYKYDNAEAYKQAICSGFKTAPKECQTTLTDKTATGEATPAGACTTPQQ